MVLVSRRQKPTLVPWNTSRYQQPDVTLQACAGWWDGNQRRPVRFASVSSVSRPRAPHFFSSTLTSAPGGWGGKIRPESPASLQPLDSRAVRPAAPGQMLGSLLCQKRQAGTAHGPFDLTSRKKVLMGHRGNLCSSDMKDKAGRRM